MNKFVKNIFQWNLVCDKEEYVEISITILNVGIAVGTFFGSFLGDVFGRKPIFIASLIFLNVVGVANAFVPEFISFCVLNFFRGIGIAVS